MSIHDSIKMVMPSNKSPSHDHRKKYIDEGFYRSKYGIGGDAFEHYCSTGWRKGWMPNAFFSPELYSQFHRIHGRDPLLHFIENWRGCSFVSPAFDIAGYLRIYPDVAGENIEPFLHYLTHGWNEGRAPGFPLYEIVARKTRHPSFDWKSMANRYGLALDELDASDAHAYVDLVDDGYYRSLYGRALGAHSPVEHYALEGWRSGLRPNPYFDPRWYASCHGVSGVDPLLHHLVTAKRPAPFFCAKSYFSANPDIGSEKKAFSHFVAWGSKERRSLGLISDHLDAIRKVESGYDWERAVAHYEFPRLLDSTSTDSLACDAGVALPGKCEEADSFQVSVFKSKARGKRLVSFDVWDTVLRRDCHPDEVKLYASSMLWRLLQRRNEPLDLNAVELFKLRRFAEYRASDSQYEYSYAAMMREWLSLCGIHSGPVADSLGSQVMEAEILHELAVTRIDPTCLAMLVALPDVRKVAISDFYFSSEVLKRLLNHHGLSDHFQSIYVSCDFMKTKREGALFDEVLTRENILPKDVLHVGDNHKADYEMALKCGMDAFHYVQANEEKRKEYLREHLNALLAGGGPILRDRLVREAFGMGAGGVRSGVVERARKETEAASVPSDMFEHVNSIDLLAIVFAGFGLFIMDKALSAKADKVFFATREGLFFRRVHDLLAARDVLGVGQYPSSSIIEVSRRATFAASLRSASTPELMRMWSMYSTQSMKAFAKSLNLDPERMQSFASEFDIPFEDPIEYPWQDERLVLMFDDPSFRGWLSAEIISQREALWDYLERIGFEPAENRTRFMVDIGWRGSIQDNLAFIVNGRIDGAYVALFRYLAEQPLNVRKHGFLVDENKDGDSFNGGDVASLEFITNSCGGSVTGYEHGVAIREAFSSEELLIKNEILPVQDAILERIESLLPLLSRSPLTWTSNWRFIARTALKQYIEKPDAGIAEIFQRLEHNETFGVGGVQRIDKDEDALEALTGMKLHAGLSEKLRSHRWFQAWLRSSKGTGFIDGLHLDQKLMVPRVPGLVRPPALVRSMGDKISIFAPEPLRGSGGHRTIYNMAKALDAAGFTVHLFSERRGPAYDFKETELAGTGVKLHSEWFSGIVPGGAIATIQHSAPYLSEYFEESVKKFYFVQDFEAEFNPVSDAYVRGENSFTEGHNHICIGRWLTHRLRAQFGCSAASAGLGVNTELYRPLDDFRRLDRIAVLFQPEKWRRLPESCLEALATVKARRPQTEIVFYGSGTRPSAAFPFTHLGLVSDLNELNRLYNSAQVGLCISLTNPSRIPYEMMAAGCVPVDVYRYNNLFDYENGTGLLAWQSPESLAEAMLHLLEDEAALAARRQKCIESAASRTLVWETDAAVNAVEHVLEGGSLDDLSHPFPSYTDLPYIARGDDRKSVRAWCAWQKKLAKMK